MSRGTEHDLEPNITFVKIFCDGYIGLNMNDKLRAIEKDISAVLEKHNYHNINIDWTN